MLNVDMVRLGEDTWERAALDKLQIAVGPYDDSDYIEIERDEETGEYRFLLHVGQETECVYSTFEEIP